jgi:hypothetical protein
LGTDETFHRYVRPERAMPADAVMVHGLSGHDEWKQIATGLESPYDAGRIRGKILLPFETAERIAAGGAANREYTTANRSPAAGQDIAVMLPPRRLRPPENRGLVSSINH